MARVSPITSETFAVAESAARAGAEIVARYFCDGVAIRTTWRAIEQDKKTMRCREQVEMSIREDGKASTVREEHVMQLWTEDSWRRFVTEHSSFEIVARYADSGEPIEWNRRLSGEDGNVYWVMKRIR